MRLKQKIYLLLRRNGVVDKYDAYFLIAMCLFFMLVLFGVAVYQGNAASFLFVPGALALFGGVVVLQIWLKSVLTELFRDNSRLKFISVCTSIFVAWTFLIAFLLKMVGLSNFPTSLFLLVIFLAPAVYTSYHVIVPWMLRVCDERSNFLHFLLFHLIFLLAFTLYIHKGGLVVDINTNLTLMTYVKLSVLIQAAVYCLFSLGASLRVALYFIFSDEMEQSEGI